MLEEKNMTKILLIDDLETNQNAASVQLKGYDVTIVGDFISFQREWGKGGWDVVLTDLYFPVDASSEYKPTDEESPPKQPQPLGAIVVLMAQHAHIPVKMVSSHGDCINYPLEAMCIAINYEVDGEYLSIEADATTLEPRPCKDRYLAREKVESGEWVCVKNWIGGLKLALAN